MTLQAYFWPITVLQDVLPHGHSGSCPTHHHFDVFVQQNTYLVLHSTRPRECPQRPPQMSLPLPQNSGSIRRDRLTTKADRHVRGCEACQEGDECCWLVNGGKGSPLKRTCAEGLSQDRRAFTQTGSSESTLRNSDDPVEAKGKGDKTSKNIYVWSMYYISSTVLSTLQHILCNPLKVSLKGRYYYSHFMKEDTEAQRDKYDQPESCIY